MLYGFWYVCGGAIGIPFTVAMIVALEADPQFVQEMGPAMGVVSDPLLAGLSLTKQGIGVLVGVLAFVSAIGLLMMRHWARRMAVAFGFALLAIFVVGIVFQVVIILSDYDPMAALPPIPGMRSIPGFNPGFLKIGQALGSVMISALLTVPYAILLVIDLRRPHVVEAFRLANWDATVEAEEAS